MRCFKCARQRCQFALKTCAIAAVRHSCASEMTSLPLQAVRRMKGSISFSQARERRSMIEHPAMQRQGRKLLTNDGAGGPLPFQSRRSTTACPPTCAIPVAICDGSFTSTPAVRRIGARSYAPASHCLATKVLTKPACGIPSARIGAGDCAGVRQGLAEDPLARVKLLEFASVDPAADAIAEGLQSARIHTQRANSPSLRLRQE